MAAWVAPLISAGASLVGKLFGGSDDNKSSNRVNYKQMVKDAEAAGFNPLTVLRAGGAAGYTTTSHPALSSANAVGAIAEAVGNFAMNFDANKAAREQAEFDLVNAQIENIQTETAQRRAAMAVPKRIAGNAHDATGRPVADNSKVPLGAMPALLSMDHGDRTNTNPFPTDWNIRRDPRVPDGSVWEEAYGEWGGPIGTAVTLWRDWKYNNRDTNFIARYFDGPPNPTRGGGGGGARGW